MTLSIMPVYTWSINITGFLLLLTLPILTGALIMSLADLHSRPPTIISMLRQLFLRDDMILLVYERKRLY
jgi:hypothetical protein